MEAKKVERLLDEAGMAYLRTGSFFALRPRSATTDVDYVVLNVEAMNETKTTTDFFVVKRDMFSVSHYVEKSNAFFESIGATLTSNDNYASAIAEGKDPAGWHGEKVTCSIFGGFKNELVAWNSEYIGQIGAIVTYRIGRVNIILVTGIDDFFAWADATNRTYSQQVRNKKERIALYRKIRLNPDEEVFMYEARRKLVENDITQLRGLFLNDHDLEGLEWET